MFYTATKEQIEQLYPELINYEPNKTRCFYKYEDGTIRWFDRIYNYYFSDRPWGLEKEMLAEGIDQEWVPGEEYLSGNIRNSIKSPDGWSFWCLDYSAEEIRLGAINTGCKLYTEAFASGKDIHTMVGEKTWGYEKYHSDKKKYRKMAKVLNFNLQYGGTPMGVARMLECSLSEATEIYNGFKDALQDHFSVQDAQVRETHKNLCEHTFYGLPIRLKRYYSGTYKEISKGERLARNCRIQGCLTYDNKILTNKGYIKIGELYDNWNSYKNTNIKVWTGDSWTNFYPNYMGKATKYKITLSNGQEFYCDNRHKIKVFGDNNIIWKCITDYDDTIPTLQVGDNICVNKNKQFTEIPIIYNQLEEHAKANNASPKDLYLNRQDILDMCYIYGSILGDGHLEYYKNHVHCGIQIHYGYTKFDNIKRVTDFLDRHNVKYIINTKRLNDATRHPMKSLFFGSYVLLKAFSELFDYTEDQTCYTKRLSDKIFTFDTEMIRQLLLGLYKTDGTQWNKSGSLHLCNCGLLEDIQRLLDLVGFKSSLHRYGEKDYLLNIIGAKGRNYTTWLETGIYNGDYIISTLPYHSNILNKYKKENDKIITETASERVSAGKVLTGKSCSIRMFRKICNQNNIKFEDYDYVTVEKIENLNEIIDTYELTVEDERQQFICDGIVNHNTGGDILSIAFMRLWKKIWEELGNPEDYVRFQITVHDEVDFIVRNDVADIIVPLIIECMIIKQSDWKIALQVGLSCGPTFGQQYEFDYHKDENTGKYVIDGPALEEVKPKKEEIKQDIQQEEKFEIVY